MTASKLLRTSVAVRTNVTAAWDANSNRLRVANASTDETLEVYSNGEIYRVMAEVPAGRVVIRIGPKLPRIVEALVHAGVIREVRRVRDSFDYTEVVEAEVLL